MLVSIQKSTNINEALPNIPTEYISLSCYCISIASTVAQVLRILPSLLTEFPKTPRFKMTWSSRTLSISGITQKHKRKRKIETQLASCPKANFLRKAVRCSQVKTGVPGDERGCLLRHTLIKTAKDCLIKCTGTPRKKTPCWNQ